MNQRGQKAYEEDVRRSKKFHRKSWDELCLDSQKAWNENGVPRKWGEIRDTEGAKIWGILGDGELEFTPTETYTPTQIQNMTEDELKQLMREHPCDRLGWGEDGPVAMVRPVEGEIDMDMYLPASVEFVREFYYRQLCSEVISEEWDIL